MTERQTGRDKAPMPPGATRTAHVLLTRFNLPSRGYESLVRARDGWLADRVGLFERYCLPSVAAQVDQDFEWLVYFDPESPAWLLDAIERWKAFPRFHPVFREEVHLPDIRGDFERLLGSPPARLITTNLDNDDGLSRSFTARLKAIDPGRGRTALFLADGLVLDGNRLFLHRDLDNAFCSVAEDWDGMVTCWCAPHNALHSRMRTCNASGPPSWLQVIHGSNVSNRIRGYRISPRPHQEDFGPVLVPLPQPGAVELLADRIWHRPGRVFREACRGTAKTLVRATMSQDGVDRAKIAWRQGRKALGLPED